MEEQTQNVASQTEVPTPDAIPTQNDPSTPINIFLLNGGFVAGIVVDRLVFVGVASGGGTSRFVASFFVCFFLNFFKKRSRPQG